MAEARAFDSCCRWTALWITDAATASPLQVVASLQPQNTCGRAQLKAFSGASPSLLQQSGSASRRHQMGTNPLNDSSYAREAEESNTIIMIALSWRVNADGSDSRTLWWEKTSSP